MHPELVCVDPLGQLATPRSWLRHLGNGASFVPVDATDEASVKTTVPKPSRPAEAVGRLQLPRAVGRPVAREPGKLALDQLA